MFKINSQQLKKDEFNIEETIYKYLYKIPPKEGRYIVLDTETTGLNESAQVVELGAHEIINGKLTGNQFHIYIRPRVQMDKNVISIHKITNTFYDEYYSDVYESDKQNLINFSKFLGNALIFAHNAPFDMNVLNSELKYWGLNEIPTKRYRCSMRIFKDIIGKINIKYKNTFTSLTNCCEYFKLKSSENNFHNALFDSFMTSRMICKIYETLDNNHDLRKRLGFNQNTLDLYINDILNKKNTKIKNDIQKKIESKNVTKKILNNMDYSNIQVNDENNENEKKSIKKDSKNEKKIKSSSVKKKKDIINCLESINDNQNKENKNDIKEPKLKIISTELISITDNQKDGINKNKNTEENDEIDFDEELTGDVIDDLFSELL